MPAKKSAPRRKRGVPAPSGPKKKQTVSAKKKHVRELAKSGRWAEIEKLYGKKILAKAKTYAEKNRVVKTPQEIARDILIKNGLLPSASQEPSPIRNQEAVESTTRVTEPWVDATVVSIPSETLTKEQQELVEKRRREALERRRVPSSSPGTLTKEQQERIEKRRREALDKRRRAQQSGTARAVVIQPDPAQHTRYDAQPSVVPWPHRQIQRPPRDSRVESSGSVEQPRSVEQPCSETHRVVTPENLPTTNRTVEPEQVRPEYFWDDLEAAAEIVQWEHEHMAEVALVQPPAKTPKDSSRAVGTGRHRLGQRMQQGKLKTQPPAVSTIPSLSQELAAAAEIIEWEKEHEAPNKPDDNADSDPELNAPQFQLLPVHAIDDFEQPKRNVIEADPYANNAKSRQASNNDSQPKPKSHRKRPLVAAPPPALSHGSAVSSKAANPGAQNRCHSTSHSPEIQRDPTAEFIDKHIMDDKLDLPVLEFLDMMLA